jgi:metal-responsive CopG/Arc/MetJ family transcriptional regulator
MSTEQEEIVQTAIRVPKALLEELDEIAENMSQPGLKVTRTEALRLAIYRGVEQLKKEGKKR